MVAMHNALNRPKIVTVEDYDGFFSTWVNAWVEDMVRRGLLFHSSEIRVTAGPFRPDAVTCRHEGHVLHIDFYSALRTGFGSLSDEDVEQIKIHWL